MIKTQESFDYFFLNDIYNVLKAHENEVNEIVEETWNILGGPFALMSTVAGREVEKETTEKESLEDKVLIINYNDEAMALYFNNRVKNFFKKPFNLKTRVGEMKGNFSKRKVIKEKKEEKKEVKYEEVKKEKKLKEDSGFDCH